MDLFALNINNESLLQDNDIFIGMKKGNKLSKIIRMNAHNKMNFYEM